MVPLAHSIQQQRKNQAPSFRVPLLALLFVTVLYTFCDHLNDVYLGTLTLPSEKGAAAAIYGRLPPPNVDDDEEEQYTAVHCQSFLRENADLDPNGHENILKRTTATPKSFYMSLHKPEVDGMRYTIFKNGRYYETDMEESWAKALSKAPEGSRILDVGGNVGYYSLYSASLGKYAIDAFEPFPSNILRFCESVGVNHWNIPGELPFVSIFGMGVSNEKKSLKFLPRLSNPGAGRFLTDDEATARKGSELLQRIPVITLDDFARDRGWFDSKPNIAILKIDAERHECEVVNGAKKLLQSGMVQNIFTEVGREPYEEQISMLQTFIDAGYFLVAKGGHKGPSHPSPWKHDKKLAETIMTALRKSRGPYYNLWWSLDPNARQAT